MAATCPCGSTNELYKKPGDNGLCLVCRQKQDLGKPIINLLNATADKLNSSHGQTHDVELAVKDLLVINRLLLDLVLQLLPRKPDG